MRHILRLSCFYLILSSPFFVTISVHGGGTSDSPFAPGAYWTYHARRKSELTFKGDFGAQAIGHRIVVEVIEGNATVKELNSTRLVVEHIRGDNYSFYVAPMIYSLDSSRYDTEIVRSTIDRDALTYLSMSVNSKDITSLVGSPSEEYVSTSLRNNQSVRYWHNLIGGPLSFVVTMNFTSFQGKDVPVIALYHNGTVIRPIDVQSDYLKKLEGSSVLNYTINTVCTANFERTSGFLLSLKLKQTGTYSDPQRQLKSTLVEVAEYAVEGASWEIPMATPIPAKPTHTATQTPATTIQPKSAVQTTAGESDLLTIGLFVILSIISLPLLEALTLYIRRRLRKAPIAMNARAKWKLTPDTLRAKRANC